jgi:phage-related baseplate assembly protein
VLLAPEAFAAAGPQAAWLFHALSADARVLNADVWSPEPGQVIVAVQGREGDGSASGDLVEAVRAHLARPDIKPLTDILTVRSVQNVGYAIAVECFILPGPAPELVRAEVTQALQAMAAARRTPSRDVPRSAVFAAASTPAVDKVLVAQPVTDIARGSGEVGICTGIDVTVTVYDG